MKNIQKFTINNATITIDGATTLQFNHNNCYQITGPYIFATAYRCGDYVLLHELQGYETDEILEPKTNKEFADGLLTMDNPYYVDYYHMLHDEISIEHNKDGYYILPKDSYNGDIFPYKGDFLKRFHLFEVDNNSWNEVELANLYEEEIVDWSCFASGMVKTDAQNISE